MKVEGFRGTTGREEGESANLETRDARAGRDRGALVRFSSKLPRIA